MLTNLCFITVKLFYCSHTVILSHIYQKKKLIKAYIPPLYWYLNSSICLCQTLFMNRWCCIKHYIKSVSVAHENVSKMSMHLTNI